MTNRQIGDPHPKNILMQKTERLLSELSYIPSTLFLSEVSYVEFLDRVHVSEKKLRAKGLWEVPHPWLNLFVPKSKIIKFNEEVFGNILTDATSGPILIYPVNTSKYLVLLTYQSNFFFLILYDFQNFIS